MPFEAAILIIHCPHHPHTSLLLNLQKANEGVINMVHSETKALGWSWCQKYMIGVTVAIVPEIEKQKHNIHITRTFY